MAKGGYRGGMPMGMGGKNQMQMMKQAQKMQTAYIMLPITLK